MDAPFSARTPPRPISSGGGGRASWEESQGHPSRHRMTGGVNLDVKCVPVDAHELDRIGIGLEICMKKGLKIEYEECMMPFHAYLNNVLYGRGILAVS